MKMQWYKGDEEPHHKCKYDQKLQELSVQINLEGY